MKRCKIHNREECGYCEAFLEHCRNMSRIFENSNLRVSQLYEETSFTNTLSYISNLPSTEDKI